MLGILYLLVGTALGWQLTRRCFARILPLTVLKTAYGRPVNLSSGPFILSASFVIGTVVLTWLLYVVLVLVRNLPNAHATANLIALSVAVTAFALMWRRTPPIAEKLDRAWVDWTVCGVAFVVALWAAHLQLFMQGNVLQLGSNVWADLCGTLSMTRSFSWGLNVPTEYTQFAGEAANYHFMFWFLAGNLEFLGLPLDWAVNLPSALSVCALLTLLYTLATVVSGRRLCGLLALAFALLRSSLAVFTWWAGLGFGGPATMWHDIAHRYFFIGTTPYEDWGVWTLNVWSNSRHAPIAMAGITLMLIELWPALTRDRKERPDFTGALMSGLLLGGLAIWEGTSVIGGLLMVGTMTIVSGFRAEPALVALTAVLIGLVEKFTLTSSAHSPLVLAWHLGGMSGASGLLPFIGYYILLLGALPFLVALSLWGSRPALRRLLAVVLTPWAVNNVVMFSLSPSTVARLSSLSYLFLGLFAAIPMAWLWDRRALGRAVFVVLFALMTLSGVVDTLIVYCKSTVDVAADFDDPLVAWARKTDWRDVFLIEPTEGGQPLLWAGRRLYLGRPYYAASAGHDVESHGRIVQAIYGAPDTETARRLAQQNNIRYIVVDEGNRRSKFYHLNEAALQGLPVAFADPSRHVVVYDAR